MFAEGTPDRGLPGNRAVGKGPKQNMEDTVLDWRWRKYSCVLFVVCYLNTVILNHFSVNLMQIPKIQAALGLC